VDTYTQKKQQQERDPDTMEVNTVQVLSSEQEKKRKLCREGKCFLCKKQGHLARDCFKKKDPKKKQMTQACTIRQIEDDEATVIEGNDSLVVQLRALWSHLRKEAFTGAMDEMIKQEDF
jgi:Zinc knuckle